MKNNIGDKARIQHIFDAISEIEKYTDKKSLSDFLEDTMLQSACIRQLEIVGEAANRLTENLKTESLDIEWREIIGLRNILIHDYFGIDLYLIWQIIEKDIPPLKIKINSLLKKLKDQ